MTNCNNTLIKHCAQVYFTTSGLLLFHCILCESRKLTKIHGLCKHLKEKHENILMEIDSEQNKPAEIKKLISNEETTGSVANKKYDLILEEQQQSPANVEDQEECSADAFDTLSELENAENINIDEIQNAEDELGDIASNSNVNEYEGESIRRRKYKCPKCHFRFKTGENLSQHISRHRPPRYACSHCSKKFYTSTELRVHERRIQGEKRFMCSECGQQYVTSSELTKHMRRHLNIRPCECNFCGKRFFEKDQLRDHYVVHTRERKFICLLCNANFFRRYALRSHMKIHANKREYVCKICGADFNQLPGLHVHMRSKHKIAVNKTK